MGTRLIMPILVIVIVSLKNHGDDRFRQCESSITHLLLGLVPVPLTHMVHE